MEGAAQSLLGRGGRARLGQSRDKGVGGKRLQVTPLIAKIKGTAQGVSLEPRLSRHKCWKLLPCLLPVVTTPILKIVPLILGSN